MSAALPRSPAPWCQRARASVELSDRPLDVASTMAPEVKHVELSERAYRKLMLHAAKYPSATVVGVLVGKHGTTVDVDDVIPLAHHWTQLSPMTEAGLAMVRVHRLQPD